MRKIMLSINRPWDGYIFDGTKAWEVRKTRPGVDGEYEVLLYEAGGNGGEGAVVGKFYVRDFLPLKEYSERVKEGTRLTREQFEAYTDGGIVYAWVVEKPKRFRKAVPLGSFGLSRPPQGWQYVDGESEDAEEVEEAPEPESSKSSDPVELVIPEPCIGVCRCCGQTRTYSRDCGMSQDERDTDTTLRCNCSGGEAIRQIERAKLSVNALFGRESGEVKDFLLRAACLVIRNEIEVVTINIDGIVKAKISKNAKEKTIIARSDNVCNRREV